jgi:tryptophan synthase alpha subunit
LHESCLKRGSFCCQLTANPDVGVPFTDPQADGATIQRANEVALEYKVSLKDCLDMVSELND